MVNKYVEELKAIREKYSGDPEVAHSYADDVLINALKELGYAEIAEAWEECYEEIGFWYA